MLLRPRCPLPTPMGPAVSSPCGVQRVVHAAGAAIPRRERGRVRNPRSLVGVAASATPSDESPQPSADDYAARLAAAEKAGDWLAAVELLTEIRILRIAAPPSAYEAAARVCADEGDWKKAVDALLAADKATASGGADCSAVLAVFRRLARELEGGPALDLLAALAPTWQSRPPSTRSIATNCAARACARGGRLDDALRLVDEGLRPGLEAGLKIEAGTLDTLAVAAAAAGRVDLYDDLLEERDYLLD